MKLRIAACLLMPLALLNAQEAQQGTISGFITDPSRAAVPRAQVTVTNAATNLSRMVESNDSGLYSFVGLQPGTYDVKASFSGFKGEERTGIVLDVGASVRIDFVMEIGSLTEVVSVPANAPVLKTETGEVSNLISGTQVTELGLNGRNFTQFLSLGTGVVSQQTGHQMGLGQEGNPLMAVNGGRISMNKYTFDGTLAMDTGGNRGLDIFPPLEAISEISVQKSNYSADVGGFGAGVVNIVTKSGTQQFHGDVYEYFRNDKLDARNFFSNERQIIRLNNFGYTLGGPVYIPGRYNVAKTKDFFFWSESWLRRVGPQINDFTSPPLGVFTAQVPTEAMRRGDFSAVAMKLKDPSGVLYPGNIIPSDQIDRNALLLLNTFYPLPNHSGAQNFVFNTASFTRYREELIRWDHNFNPNWTWTVRYAQDSWTQDQNIMRPSSTTLPTIPGLFEKPGKNLTTKVTSVLTPETVNLFTFGFAENKIFSIPRGGQRPAGLTIPKAYSSDQYDAIPDITLAQGFANIGIGNPLVNSNPIFTWKDDFSLTRGTHSFKIGAEIIYHRKNQINYNNEHGVFNFNGGVTGNAMADFLIGRAFTYTENDKDPGVEVEASDSEFYVQDDWKATRSLTLNLGVRLYFVHGGNGGAAVANNIAAFVPSLYSPAKVPLLNSNGTIVPGSGDPLNGIITPADRKGIDLGRALKKNNDWVPGPRFGFAWSPGSRKTVIRGGYGINYFWGTDSDASLKDNPPFTSSVNIQNTLLSNPLGGANRIFPSNLTTPDVFNKLPSVQSWSLNIQREVMAATSVEIGYVGTRGNHLPRTLQLDQADPASNTNANLRRPYLGYGSISYNENSAISRYNSLQTALIRRFSKGLMLEASYTFSKALGNPEGMPLDSRNKDLDYGLSTLDRTHVFSFNYVWQLPFFQSARGIAAAVLGGWQWAGITTFQSGLPINITQAGDVANFGGNTGPQRPDLVGDPNQGRGNSLYRYFNVDAFHAVTQTGRIGNAPFDAVRGPGIANFDMTLSKSVPIHERYRMQFGVETFNTFNHAQFEGVGAQTGSATFGIITSARDPRVLQLRAKMSF